VRQKGEGEQEEEEEVERRGRERERREKRRREREDESLTYHRLLHLLHHCFLHRFRRSHYSLPHN
jgi:hypothetical protein